MPLLLRYLWPLPNTLLGLALVTLALATGGSARVVDGVIESHGGAVRWALQHCTPLKGGVLAITFGHTVLAVTPAALDATREHERIHVRQYERWGPAFLPAYLLATLIAWLRGGHFYRDNHFEREAFRPKPPQ